MTDHSEHDRENDREERQYEAMQRWYHPEPCRCRQYDMPGQCPGPAFCPMCQPSRDEDE